jgi:hypothetical protein
LSIIRRAGTGRRQSFELPAIEFGPHGQILQTAEWAHCARLHQALRCCRTETAHESQTKAQHWSCARAVGFERAVVVAAQHIDSTYRHPVRPRIAHEL